MRQNSGWEKILRSGTLASHLVVRFGETCQIAKEENEIRSSIYNHACKEVD